MSIQTLANIRSRKLGVLIRDARLAEDMTIQECSQLLEVEPGLFQAWEEGNISPSLPELEVLSYCLNIPLSHFWSKKTKSEAISNTNLSDLAGFVGIRHRLIGALLRQMREKVNISSHSFSKLSGISIRRLNAYELGEYPIPLPELESMTELLGGNIEMFFDRTGRIGLWMLQQETIQDFLKLPPELQFFICKPVNRPFLEMAMKFSDMSADTLKALVESLPVNNL